MLYHSVILLLSVNLALSFPLDEEVCDGNNFKNTLQCFDIDDFGIYEDSCKAKSFNRREISNYKELEDTVKTPEEENQDQDTKETIYVSKTKHHRNSLTHQEAKKHRSGKKYSKDKCYKISPFHYYMPKFCIDELNAQSIESVENNFSGPAEEDEIKEEMIDHPDNCEEIHVDTILPQEQTTNENIEELVETTTQVMEEISTNIEATETEIKEDSVKEDKVKEDDVKKEKVKESENKKDKVKEDKVKEDKVKADKVKEDKVKEDKVKEDKVKEDKVKEDEVKEDKVKEVKVKEDKVKDDKVKEDTVKDDKAKEDKTKEEIKSTSSKNSSNKEITVKQNEKLTTESSKVKEGTNTKK